MHRLLSISAVIAISATAALITGCDSGVTTATVKGEVTLDGKPLKEGLIRFVPADGQTPTADAIITDGKYSASVPRGEKRVEIFAPKDTGKSKKMYDTPESKEVPITEELLPARYNLKSELAMTVEKGMQERKFELKSD